MQNKKNWTQNLENYRGIFFMLGIALSLAAVTEIFHWTTEYHPPSLEGEAKEQASESGVFVPRIPRQKPEIPEPEIKEPEPEPVVPKNTQKFKVVANNTQLRPQLLTGSEPLDTIGFTSVFTPEILTPIEAVNVEHMARPKDCEDLHGRKEQLDCFNKWVQSYIANETNFPERARQFGESERIYVEFVINTEGLVEQAKVIRGNNVDLREEALRVIKAMPELVPASQLGQKVPVRVRIPVNFKLR
jgi:protein TonB